MEVIFDLFFWQCYLYFSILHENVTFWRKQALSEEGVLGGQGLREVLGKQPQGRCTVHSCVGISLTLPFFLSSVPFFTNENAFDKQDPGTDSLIAGRACPTNSPCKTIR